MERFGFVEYAKQNGMLWFLVDKPVKINIVGEEMDSSTGKKVVRKHELDAVKEGMNNKTQKEARLYKVSIDRTNLELSISGETATLEIDRGKLTWR